MQYPEIDPIRLDLANQRDTILFGEGYNPKEYAGGIREFKNTTVETLEKLVEADLFDAEGRHNAAPSQQEILDFLKARTSTGWYVDGYAVSPARNDYRYAITTIGKIGKATEDEVKAFVKLVKYADERIINDTQLFAWFD